MNIKINMAQLVMIMIIVYVSYRYMNSDWANLKCIIADKNGKRYCVRDRNNIDDAANLLASAVEIMKKLVNYVGKKYPDDERVIRLVKGFNAERISETLPTSEHTAYSENKGEKIAFCLNKKTNHDKKLIDLNTLVFVSIHELSHVMTESIGHKPEFWDNMKFLLENAVEIKVYTPVDYSVNNEVYCGDPITNNPLFDE